MLQVSDVTKKEALLAFQNGLKLWVKQKIEQRGVQKLLEAMIDHKEDVVDSKGNGDNGGNRKL
ncbi:hypothetical protein Goklo_002777 [Gossypium klotzschianum]|uniref:Uncharacterized protein n=1 Tax=Gossypium klotzschianum TaxID=34286 RepID=A0A7J8VVB8_9ROSI|nr:hypothetical protein [Gossypium klotzschianum]